MTEFGSSVMGDVYPFHSKSFARHHISIRNLNAWFGTKLEAFKGVRVKGQVLAWFVNHSKMACRSNDCPVLVMTGQSIISLVIGQRKSLGTTGRLVRVGAALGLMAILVVEMNRQS